MSLIVFAQLFARYFPACLFSLVMSIVVAWQLRPGILKNTLIISLSLLSGALLIIPFFIGYYSIDLLFYNTAVLALFMDFLFVFYVYRWSTGKLITASTARTNPFVVVCLLCLLCGFATWRFVEDYIMPHRVVTGVVGDVVYHRRRRAPGHHEVYIGNKAYTVTEDLLPALYHGATIRAETGAGTGVILSFVLLGAHSPVP